jgi:O-methyltransferase
MEEWSIDPGQLVYHKGWFQNTLPTDAPQLFDRGIALLRLDGDLYESTKVCLRYLHPLVAEGGYVIVDDYALTGCRKAVTEYGDSLRHHLEADHKIADDNGFTKINTIAGGNGGVWYRKDWK